MRIAMRPLFKILSLGLAFVVFAGDADARRHHRTHGTARSAPTTDSAADKRDNNTLCNGGMMITSDDQIKGCSALIKAGLSRERRAVALYNRGNAYVGKNDFARAIQDTARP